MNLAIIIHWLAFAAVLAFAVSLVVYVCREIGAWLRRLPESDVNLTGRKSDELD